MSTPVPDIPFPAVIADGSQVQLHVGRTYQLTYHSPADARQDWVMSAGRLRVIERTQRHGPRFVFNGSPRFGDHPLYGNQILAISEAGAGAKPDLRPVPRGQRGPARPDAGVRELRITGMPPAVLYDEFHAALAAAREQFKVTYVSEGGKRLAAIVPASTAELFIALLAELQAQANRNPEDPS